MVADISPWFQFYVTFFSIVGDDVDRFFFLINSGNDTNRTVYPPTIEIIFDEDDLCTGFEYKLLWSRQTAFRKISFDNSFKSNGFSGELC